MQRSVLYTVLFATGICIVCAIVVSSAAVSLKPAQDINAALEKQRNVLMAAGLLEADEKVDADEVQRRFENIRMVVVNLETGEENPDIDASSFDQVRATKDPQSSSVAPANRALVRRLPDNVLVYKVLGDDGVEGVVLPVEGYGLWSTMYGFIALEKDWDTVRGITFYQHGETPGLGGEIDNPKWKARWVGRKTFGEGGEPKLSVIKGLAGPPAEDPYRVDGLSGATLTSNGVTNLLHFWLGDEALGPYLERLSQRRAI